MIIKRNQFDLCLYLFISMSTFLSVPASCATTSPRFSWMAFLQSAVDHSFAVKSAKARVERENSKKNFIWSPEKPAIELMNESQPGNSMQWLGVRQGFAFPGKAWVQLRVQEARLTREKNQLLQDEFDFRRQFNSAFFDLWLAQKTLAIYKSQSDLLIQSSRIASVRMASGVGSQQEEMKLHLEQARIESERMLTEAEISRAKAVLYSLSESSNELWTDSELLVKLPALPEKELSFHVNDVPRVRMARAELQEAIEEKNSALFEYLPDFQLSARKTTATSMGGNQSVVALEFSFPLWFGVREASLNSQAQATVREREARLTLVERDVLAEMKRLTSLIKALSSNVLLQNTSVLPQQESMLNTALAGYRSGKIPFIELRDTERMVLEGRLMNERLLIQRYKTVAEWEQLTAQRIFADE